MSHDKGRGPQNHVDDRKRNIGAEEMDFRDPRRLEMRLAEVEPYFHMNYDDPLHIDPDIIPAGWVYKWGRDSILNEPDTGNSARMDGRGWSPVPASRHPQLRRAGIHAHLSGNGFIRYMDVVLMERPAILEKMDSDKLAELNMSLMSSMPSTEHFMGQKGFPTFVKNNELSVGVQRGFTG